MPSYAQTSRSHKSKNPKEHEEDSSGVTLTLRNPSKPKFSKTLSAPARLSREPSSSSDRNEIEKLTLQRTSMKLSVQPERETEDEYENEADDDFAPSPQQSCQTEYHGLKKNLFDEEKDAFISDYHSDPKPSRCHTSLNKKQIDLEMLKEKNRNLELQHAMKRACTLSGPEESFIPTRFGFIKRLKNEEIYHQTQYENFCSFCHQIKSGSES